MPAEASAPYSAESLPSYCYCSAGAADVVQAVQFAAAHNLIIAVKGGGYSWVKCCEPADGAILFVQQADRTCTVVLQRNLWTADKGLVVDMSAMNAVCVNAAHREITVQG